MLVHPHLYPDVVHSQLGQPLSVQRLPPEPPRN